MALFMHGNQIDDESIAQRADSGCRALAQEVRKEGRAHRSGQVIL